MPSSPFAVLHELYNLVKNIWTPVVFQERVATFSEVKWTICMENALPQLAKENMGIYLKYV